MLINIINKSSNPLPKYATSGASGMDLMANLSESLIVESMQRVLVPTGIFIEIPMGFEAQIRSRSGLSINKGIIVANSPGTIDADYRGEIKVIIINLSKEDFTIQHGDRIAQMVICPIQKIELVEVEELPSTTERQNSGFGSTGVR